MDIPIYDIARGKYKGESVIKLLTVVNGKKQKVSVPYPVRPFFFALPEFVSPKGLEAVVRGTTVRETDALTWDGRKVVKVEVNEPQDVPILRKVIGPENCMEADVPFPRRCLIETGLSVTAPPPEWKGYFDIETDSSEGMPDEQRAEARILSIALVGAMGAEEVVLLEEETDDAEEKLIKTFLEATKQYVALGTYFGNKFDVPYLENRCRRLGMWYPWRSWVHVDIVAVYRDVLQLEPPYSLESVSQRFLGRGKMKHVDRTRIKELFDENPQKLAEYNLEDARLTRDLDARFGAIDMMFRVAEMSHCSVPDLFWRRDKKKMGGKK